MSKHESSKSQEVIAIQTNVPSIKYPQKGTKWIISDLEMEFLPVDASDGLFENVLFGKYETRVKDFEVFVKETGYDPINAMHDAINALMECRSGISNLQKYVYTWKDPGFSQGPSHPVVCVSWDDAQKYCIWLTDREKKSGRLFDHQRYRLPTDEEWSRAVGLPWELGDTPADRERNATSAIEMNFARNERTPAEKYVSMMEIIYPWGEVWPPPKGAGNYKGEEALTSDDTWQCVRGYNDGYKWTAPVGSFMANKFGLYDMGGNVEEWVQDFCHYQNQKRIVRGGGWRDWNVLPSALLSVERLDYDPTKRTTVTGFRVVLSLVNDLDNPLFPK